MDARLGNQLEIIPRGENNGEVSISGGVIARALFFNEFLLLHKALDSSRPYLLKYSGWWSFFL